MESGSIEVHRRRSYLQYRKRDDSKTASGADNMNSVAQHSAVGTVGQFYFSAGENRNEEQVATLH